MGEWTTAQVQDRLELAAGVMRQMPGVMPQGFFNAWPEYFHSFADKVGQEPQMRRPRPSPRQITQAEEAMLWLRWLEPEDARLVWAPRRRQAWKPICWQFGISRARPRTERWQYGLAVIVWRLNGRVPSRKRSIGSVVAGASRHTAS